MPIPVDDLLAGRVADTLRGGSRPAQVLGFLRARSGEAFTAAELAEEFGTDHRTLRSVLARLLARGFVEKKGAYWYAPDEETEASKRAFLATTRDLDRRFGREKKEDWPSVPPPTDG